MSSSLVIKADELIDAEIQWLEGEIATFQKKVDDLRSLKSPPKAGTSTPSSATSGRTQSLGGDWTDPKPKIKAAAEKVKWNMKGEGYGWAFAANKDGSANESKDLAALIKLSATGKVSDGDFEYKFGSDPKFIGKSRVKKD